MCSLVQERSALPPVNRTSTTELRSLLVTATVLLVALGLRTHDLLRFPPFIDEAHHILWASDVYSLHPLTGAANGKLFGLWWMAAFGMDGDGALWLARAATGLFSLIAVAGMYRLGAALASRTVGLLAALAYSIAPLAIFFERMALVDPYVVGFGVLTALFSLMAARHGRRRDAVLAGLALCGAVLAKATGVMLAAIPLLTLLLMHRAAWRKPLQAVAVIFGIFVAFWGPFFLLLRWRGYNYIGTATTVVGTDDLSDALDRLLDNFRAALRIDILYLGVPLVGLAGLCALYIIVRRPRTGLYLVLSALLPLAGLLLFATRLSTRYIQFHLPFLLLIVLVGVWSLANDLARKRRLGAIVLPSFVLLLWAATAALPFLDQLERDPLALALPHMDRIEYFVGDSAGFALPDVAQKLTTESAEKELPSLVFGLISNCEGLRRILPAASNVVVECPPVALDGSRQAELAARFDALAAATTSAVWLVLEDQAPYFSLDGIKTALEAVATYARPDEVTQMTLFRRIP
jgi:hypothetical protein